MIIIANGHVNTVIILFLCVLSFLAKPKMSISAVIVIPITMYQYIPLILFLV